MADATRDAEPTAGDGDASTPPRPRRPAHDQQSGHDDAVEEAMAEAARTAETDQPFGRPGRPLNRRSPFYVGMTAAAGVAVTYVVFELLVSARNVLVLIGLALFLAIGLEPPVAWLVGRRLPRGLAVLGVLTALVGVLGLFVWLAVTPLVHQATTFSHQLPHYIHDLQDHNSFLGRLNDRFHLEQRASQLFDSSGGSGVLSGVLGAGRVVLSAATSFVTVLALTVYFLVDLPRIRRSAYRLVPRARRPRVILLTEEITAKIGAYLLGNLITSFVAGLGTFVWLLCFGVPYPLLLGLFVALVDLVPVVGSTIGGVVVSLIALVVSLPVAIATACFYVAYRLAEDYLLVPKIVGRAVEVPGVATVVAVLIGGALLGVIGALVAIPVAAAARLIVREVALPRLDR